MWLSNVVKDMSRYAKGYKGKWQASIMLLGCQTMWFTRDELVDLHEVIGAMLYGDLIQLKQQPCGCLEPKFARKP